jgi:DNA invertase Pin-like site-specific DNA recombinase
MQVREHTESTARQYGLAQEAARLGWPSADIEVIDADLGLSGRSVTHRDGFKHLVARVCLGEVGAVFGLEVSRLARSNADLSRLLELARLTDTLVIDADGVYDLADINDRLLLGLKSQMSEAEIHLLTSRLGESKRAAARRGDLRVPLPVGYVYDDENVVVIDPDAEVAAAVADVFASFTATGSAYGVAGAFAGRRFPRRAYGGVWAGQIRWGRLTHARAAGILSNPVYAGAYVFGRRRTRQVVHPDGSVHSCTTPACSPTSRSCPARSESATPTCCRCITCRSRCCASTGDRGSDHRPLRVSGGRRSTWTRSSVPCSPRSAGSRPACVTPANPLA